MSGIGGNHVAISTECALRLRPTNDDENALVTPFNPLQCRERSERTCRPPGSDFQQSAFGPGIFPTLSRNQR